jgi:hypothetical protein
VFPPQNNYPDKARPKGIKNSRLFYDFVMGALSFLANNDPESLVVAVLTMGG